MTVLSPTSTTTREQWLGDAAIPLIDMIVELTSLSRPKNVQVSCGWPRLDRGGKVIGQCWPTKTGNGAAQIFITPLLTDPVRVLDTLLHELIHAADDCEHRHSGPFTRAIRAVGLAGKPTSTYAAEGTDLHAELLGLAEALGPYPHQGLVPGARLVKPQKTRMLKYECDSCGYTLRTTRKWAEISIPICPNINCTDYTIAMTGEVRETPEGRE